MTQKNSLLITIDSLRSDYSNEDTPCLVSATGDGVKFSSAFATGPGTTPSFPAMLTGTLPLSYEGLGPLADDRPRVSTFLNDAGLTTGGFQCNPFLSSHFNYDVGFDTFEDYQNPLMGIATKVFPRGIEINNPKIKRVDDMLHFTDVIKKSYQLIKGKPRPYVSADVITDDTIDWIKKTSTPFHVWTHYMDVHHPCFPPKQYRREYGVGNVTQNDVSEWYSALLKEPEALSDTEICNLRKLYDAAIAYVDNQIQRIIDTLRTEGLYDDTLIIITSDHGELFGSHGQYGKPERMYDELLHVPLIVVNGPDYLYDAKDQMISLLDIPPLIHKSLGINVPSEYEGQIPGFDEAREYIMAEHEVHGEVIVGARSNDWLYEGDEIAGEHRLFDLRNGIEQVDTSTAGGELVRSAVLSRLNELDVEARYLQEDMDSEVEERLESLGYK
ncbi:sulfatase [Salinigranum marinum]|uniref:sulfatase n=1 Tax=Salinigranum marinum TaxID=1515595 RepID=UPI00298A0417|nr:sulfatase [Salinigranum marinum]